MKVRSRHRRTQNRECEGDLFAEVTAAHWNPGSRWVHAVICVCVGGWVQTTLSLCDGAGRIQSGSSGLVLLPRGPIRSPTSPTRWGSGLAFRRATANGSHSTGDKADSACAALPSTLSELDRDRKVEPAALEKGFLHRFPPLQRRGISGEMWCHETVLGT